ncbi:MAG: hypothetical protein EOO61_22870 [Hymenobacter sp.]|nr:MAG: hypothetical protein EOO61_22870 [Hymenobacter sp.]
MATPLLFTRSGGRRFCGIFGDKMPHLPNLVCKGTIKSTMVEITRGAGSFSIIVYLAFLESVIDKWTKLAEFCLQKKSLLISTISTDNLLISIHQKCRMSLSAVSRMYR